MHMNGFFLFLLLLGFTSGCFKGRKPNTSAPSGDQNAYLKPTTQQDSSEPENLLAYPKNDMVSASTLEVKGLALRNKAYDAYQTLIIDVEINTLVDEYQFVICTKGSTTNCHPREEEKETFKITPFEFPDPPAGEIEVKVRACANRDRLVDPLVPCGSWRVHIPNQ